MGKAIDALYDAMTAIRDDGSLYLNEDFMNSIFDKIYINDDGNPAPLPPLQEAMKYLYEEKQTNAIDGSKRLPFDGMNADMFYPTRQENIDSTPTVKVMAAEEVARAVIGQIIDPQKALSDYTSAVDGKFSWGQMFGSRAFGVQR
jgi:hypothetical protein